MNQPSVHYTCNCGCHVPEFHPFDCRAYDDMGRACCQKSTNYGRSA